MPAKKTWNKLPFFAVVTTKILREGLPFKLVYSIKYTLFPLEVQQSIGISCKIFSQLNFFAVGLLSFSVPRNSIKWTIKCTISWSLWWISINEFANKIPVTNWTNWTNRKTQTSFTGNAKPLSITFSYFMLSSIKYRSVYFDCFSYARTEVAIQPNVYYSTENKIIPSRMSHWTKKCIPTKKNN